MDFANLENLAEGRIEFFGKGLMCIRVGDLTYHPLRNIASFREHIERDFFVVSAVPDNIQEMSKRLGASVAQAIYSAVVFSPSIIAEKAAMRLSDSFFPTQGAYKYRFSSAAAYRSVCVPMMRPVSGKVARSLLAKVTCIMSAVGSSRLLPVVVVCGSGLGQNYDSAGAQTVGGEDRGLCYLSQAWRQSGYSVFSITHKIESKSILGGNVEKFVEDAKRSFNCPFQLFGSYAKETPAFNDVFSETSARVGVCSVFDLWCEQRVEAAASGSVTTSVISNSTARMALADDKDHFLSEQRVGARSAQLISRWSGALNTPSLLSAPPPVSTSLLVMHPPASIASLSFNNGSFPLGPCMSIAETPLSPWLRVLRSLSASLLLYPVEPAEWEHAIFRDLTTRSGYGSPNTEIVGAECGAASASWVLDKVRSLITNPDARPGIDDDADEFHGLEYCPNPLLHSSQRMVDEFAFGGVDASASIDVTAMVITNSISSGQQPSGIAGPRAGRSSAAWGLDRADEDFTERLFPLLAASRSPAELKAAIQLLFCVCLMSRPTFTFLIRTCAAGGVMRQVLSACEKGDIFPSVHRSNRTLLGNLLRDAVRLVQYERYGDAPESFGGRGGFAHGSDSNDSMSPSADLRSLSSWREAANDSIRGSGSLRLALELGIWKLRRDFAHAFDLRNWASASGSNVLSKGSALGSSGLWLGGGELATASALAQIPSLLQSFLEDTVGGPVAGNDAEFSHTANLALGKLARLSHVLYSLLLARSLGLPPSALSQLLVTSLGHFSVSMSSVPTSGSHNLSGGFVVPTFIVPLPPPLPSVTSSSIGDMKHWDLTVTLVSSAPAATAPGSGDTRSESSVLRSGDLGYGAGRGKIGPESESFVRTIRFSPSSAVDSQLVPPPAHRLLILGEDALLGIRDRLLRSVENDSSSGNSARVSYDISSAVVLEAIAMLRQDKDEEEAEDGAGSTAGAEAEQWDNCKDYENDFPFDDACGRCGEQASSKAAAGSLDQDYVLPDVLAADTDVDSGKRSACRSIGRISVFTCTWQSFCFPSA